MATIETIVEKDGSASTTIKTVQGEDPACNVFQKIVNGLGQEGIVVEKTQVDVQAHGHVHDFTKNHVGD